MGNTSYPYAYAPPSAAAVEGGEGGEGAASLDEGLGDSVATYTVEEGSSEDEVVVVPKMPDGLGAYRKAASGVATALVARGPARAIITFARPISIAELRDLQADGLHVETVEAVTTDEHGPRWSIGGAAGPSLDKQIQASVDASGEKLLGIVAAQAIVERTSLKMVQTDERVALVDLSIEHYARGHKEARDIVMNDINWMLAGWNEDE